MPTEKIAFYVAGHVAKALAGGVKKLATDQPTLGLAPVVTHADKLKADGDLLHEAFSDMARRNLLSDLLRTAKAMQAPLKAGAIKAKTAKIPDAISRAESCEGLCTSLIKRCEGLLNAHSPTRMRYARAVCVGYKLKVANATYQGETDDSDDMHTRCNDMIGAIQAAYALVDGGGRQLNGDNTVLKVFVAPEFFFRGRNGAYSHAVVHGTDEQTKKGGDIRHHKHRGIVELLRHEIDKPAYKDWLFVLGTAIAATAEVETRCKHTGCVGKVKFERVTGRSTTVGVCSIDRTHAVGEVVVGAMVENVAFVSKEGWRHSVSKELVSGVDFLEKAGPHKDAVTVPVGRSKTETQLDVMRHPQPSGYRAATNVPTKFTDERMGGCVFTVDGITFGLEVCLDHAATRSASNKGRLNHAANIQIQLIPSAGMTIGSLRTVQGGIVFNVDGSTPHVQVIAGANPEITFSYDQEFLFQGANWAALRNIGADLKELEKLKNSGGGSWGPAPATPTGPAGSGSVVLYGPYDIPPV